MAKDRTPPPASRLPGTPALVGLAAAAGLIVGGIPVLIVVLRRGPTEDVGVATGTAPKVESSKEDEQQRLRRLAGAGDADAMFELGRGLFEGVWGVRDLAEAERWLSRAIDADGGGRTTNEAAKTLAALKAFVRASRNERELQAASEPKESDVARAPAPRADPARSPEPRPALDPAPAPVPPDASGSRTRPPAPRPTPAPEPGPTPAPEPAPRPSPPPRPIDGGASRPPAPAPLDPAPLDEPDDVTSASPASDPAQVAALERDLRKRVQSWFKAREPEALTCRDCGGKKEVECKRCNGSSRTACPQCGGTASIQVVETVPGRSMTGVRTVRRKIDCPGCESGDVTCRCEDGKTPCECAEDHGGVTAGYRGVSGRKAFWDFISPTARRGKKQDEFFPAVARGEVLEDFAGPALGVVDADVQQVTIERDRAVVVARVVYVARDGARTPGESRTTWIKEKGKFYLLMREDVSPERLKE